MLDNIKIRSFKLHDLRIPDGIGELRFYQLANIFLLVLYTLNALFIPYDNFQLKKLALGLLIIINIRCYFHIRKMDEIFAVFFGSVVMMATVVQSTLFSGGFFSNLKIGYTFSILLLYPIIKMHRIDYIKLLAIGTMLLAFFIVGMFLLDLVGVLPIYSNPILMWLYRTENANIGKYPSLLIGISLFLKASPLLLAGMAYSFEKKKLFLSLIFLVAIVLTGTRANMFMGIACFGFCYIYSHKKVSERTVAVILLLAAAGFVIYKMDFFNWIQEVAKKKVNSDGIRTGTLDSMFLYWKQHPLNFFFGSGYMGEFYNSGRKGITRDVELSYWNLLRQVGLFQFCILMYMYVKPIIVLLKKKTGYLYIAAYVAYLLIAYTNPFLITSTGLTMVLFMYCVAYRKKKQSDLEQIITPVLVYAAEMESEEESDEAL